MTPGDSWQQSGVTEAATHHLQTQKHNHPGIPLNYTHGALSSIATPQRFSTRINPPAGFLFAGSVRIGVMPIYTLQAVADFICVEAATLEEALEQAPLAILSRGLTIFADREYGEKEINELEKDKNWEPEMGSREWLIGKELEDWYKGNVLPSQN